MEFKEDINGMFILQPNLLFARWTKAVDDFTHTNMTEDQATAIYMEYNEGVAHQDAQQAIRDLVQSPQRCFDFHDILQGIVRRKKKNGPRIADEKRELMSKHPHTCKMEKH